MNLEWFLKLKEYDSLSKMRIKHLKAKQEQEGRLSALKKRQDESLLQTEKLKQTYLSLQQKLFETEKKIKTAQEQAQRLRDIGGDETKINTYLSEMNSHEETGLEILTALELNELELQEVKGFLSGLEKTILEITHEVETEIAQEEKSISHIDQRLQSLMDELPDDFKMILQKTLTRNLALGPFTRIEAGSCYFCRYKISRIDESEIDMQKKIKICPQCSRIFLPYGA